MAASMQPWPKTPKEPKKSPEKLEDSLNSPTQSPVSPPQRSELDILVLGQAGSGKSSTGNSLLLRGAFKTSNSSSYGNLDIQSAWNDYDAHNGKLYRIKVIDGASPGDIDPTIESNKCQACENIAKILLECPKGFHVIVITVRLGVLFTDEYKIFEHHLVKNCFDKHGVIVVTWGDELINGNLDDEKRANSFKQWCGRQKGNLKLCFEKCQDRIVLFDNETKDESLRKKQLESFLSVFRELPTKDRYTNALFHKIPEKPKLDIKQPAINSEIRKYVTFIRDKIVLVKGKFPQGLEEIEGVLNNIFKLIGDETQSGQDDMGGHSVNDTYELNNESCFELCKLVSKLQNLLRKLEDEKLTSQDREEVNQRFKEFLKNASFPQYHDLYEHLAKKVITVINSTGLVRKSVDFVTNKRNQLGGCCIL